MSLTVISGTNARMATSMFLKTRSVSVAGSFEKAAVSQCDSRRLAKERSFFDNIHIFRFCSLEKRGRRGCLGRNEDKTSEPSFQPNSFGFIPFLLVPWVRIVSWKRHGTVTAISLLSMGLAFCSLGFWRLLGGTLPSSLRLYPLHFGRVRTDRADHLCDPIRR